jgi:hypothetical protein
MNFFTKLYQIFHNTRFEKQSEKLDQKKGYAKKIEEKIICLIHKK